MNTLPVTTEGLNVTTENVISIMNEYLSILSERWYSKFEDILLGISPCVHVPQSILDNWKLRKIQEPLDKMRAEIAQFNNEELVMEKQLRIDDAIKCYEENIKLCYPATHSYERLMILYRKRKQYQDELRVIDSAIEVFSAENERRYQAALSKPENKKYMDQVHTAMQLNQGVKNAQGWYIFNPYPVLKYSERREKVLKLMIN